MAKTTDKGHKLKLLKLMEIFRQETDEQHPMLASTVCEKLATHGIPCDRRTLTRDIRLLNDSGYEIMSVLIGHEKAYYVEDRSFSVPELKVLIDAVQASGFITKKKTDELTSKLAALAGGNRARLLTDNLVCFNTRKHSNEAIYYTVNYLEEAIRRQKKAVFLYYDINENGEKVYRKEGHHYVVEPVALVCLEDNYYLISYSPRHDATLNYRLDRMSGVEVLDEDVCEKALSLRGDVSTYTEQAFKMYSGDPVQVTLLFADHLMGVVYDKFGEDLPMTRVGENLIKTTICVQLAPTFWGWLFQFGDNMRLLSPESAKQAFREHIDKIISLL